MMGFRHSWQVRLLDVSFLTETSLMHMDNCREGRRKKPIFDSKNEFIRDFPCFSNSHSWSELPLDLLISVFERLSFATFQRSKSVCSSWYSASRHSVPKNQIHWSILFPEDNNNNNNNDNNNNDSHYSCTLYNPDEKDKLYKTQDFGVEFAKSLCKATYGSWLLMKDPLNLFTNERINLPPVELLWKDYELNTTRRQKDTYNGRIKSVRSPVFWIDEKTKDYLVIWGFGFWCVVYSKKGDTSWNKIPETSFCFNMVYRDHKLYFLNFHDEFKIFDFSGEVPQQTFEWMVYVDKWPRHHCHPPDNIWHSNVTTLVVTLTGKVLKVERMWVVSSRTWSLRVFEVYSSDLQKKKQWQIHSLGDESILLDQGITVLANDTDGFVRNTIYFSDPLFHVRNHIFTFNLETQKTEPLHTFDISSFQFSSAQWFVPSSFTLT